MYTEKEMILFAYAVMRDNYVGGKNLEIIQLKDMNKFNKESIEKSLEEFNDKKEIDYSNPKYDV